jgi:hypothetical protein
LAPAGDDHESTGFPQFVALESPDDLVLSRP